VVAVDAGEIGLQSLPDANLTASGLIVTVDVNSNPLGVGSPMYITQDGDMKMADASDITTSPALAIALETGTGNKKVLLFGTLRDNSWNWLTGPGESAFIYLSTTAGLLTQTPPSGTDEVVQVVGWAINSDTIMWCPQLHVVEHM